MTINIEKIDLQYKSIAQFIHTIKTKIFLLIVLEITIVLLLTVLSISARPQISQDISSKFYGYGYGKRIVYLTNDLDSPTYQIIYSKENLSPFDKKTKLSYGTYSVSKEIHAKQKNNILQKYYVHHNIEDCQDQNITHEYDNVFPFTLLISLLWFLVILVINSTKTSP